MIKCKKIQKFHKLHQNKAVYQEKLNDLRFETYMVTIKIIYDTISNAQKDIKCYLRRQVNSVSQAVRMNCQIIFGVMCEIANALVINILHTRCERVKLYSILLHMPCAPNK